MKKKMYEKMYVCMAWVSAAVLFVGAATGAFSFGPTANPCSQFFDLDTTVFNDFGVQPFTLDGRSDNQFISQILNDPDNLVLKQVAIARSATWDVLKFRTVIVGDEAQIPDGAGTWRTAQGLLHQESGGKYDIVHWQDVDDSTRSFYFKKATTDVCFVGE